MSQFVADHGDILASDAAPPKTAFVFQGGGSLSAPQVGMLRALVESGIRPDLVIGSSAGALNAVAFATDPTDAGIHRLEELWLTLRWRNVAKVSLPLLVRALLGRRDGLVDASPLIELLTDGMVATRLENTALPAHVVTTDLMTAEPVVLSSGNTVTALLASSAFPGIYEPVPCNGLQLIDGGVSADIPVLQAEALGAQVCYVLPAAISDDAGAPPHGPLAMAPPNGTPTRPKVWCTCSPRPPAPPPTRLTSGRAVASSTTATASPPAGSPRPPRRPTRDDLRRGRCRVRHRARVHRGTASEHRRRTGGRGC
jgi:predicted acylesterase/phospholipase RssA